MKLLCLSSPEGIQNKYINLVRKWHTSVVCSTNNNQQLTIHSLYFPTIAPTLTAIILGNSSSSDYNLLHW